MTPKNPASSCLQAPGSERQLLFNDLQHVRRPSKNLCATLDVEEQHVLQSTWPCRPSHLVTAIRCTKRPPSTAVPLRHPRLSPPLPFIVEPLVLSVAIDCNLMQNDKVSKGVHETSLNHRSLSATEPPSSFVLLPTWHWCPSSTAPRDTGTAKRPSNSKTCSKLKY